MGKPTKSSIPIALFTLALLIFVRAPAKVEIVQLFIFGSQFSF